VKLEVGSPCGHGGDRGIIVGPEADTKKPLKDMRMTVLQATELLVDH
jgi:hypothetical protein